MQVKPFYPRSNFYLLLSFISFIALIVAGNYYFSPCSTSPTVTSISPSSSVPHFQSNNKRQSSCKKGVGYNSADLPRQLNVCWAYNWASTQDPNSGGLLPGNVEFVPIL